MVLIPDIPPDTNIEANKVHKNVENHEIYMFDSKQYRITDRMLENSEIKVFQ